MPSPVPNNEATQFSGERAVECGKKGSIASAKAKREKKELHEAVKWILTTDLSDIKAKNFDDGSIATIMKERGLDIKKMTTSKMAALGLWYGSILGNSTNFKTLGEYNNEENTGEEIQTPLVQIEILDNSHLEKTLYEANRHNENDEG